MAQPSLPWNPTPRQIELFWRKIVIRGEDECWPHRDGPNQDHGYRDMMLAGWHTTMHRIAFALANGYIPELSVLHSCDNRCCANPNHLYEGTQLENIRDMIAKGRAGDCRNFGEKHGRCKITDDQVAELRALHAGGWLSGGWSQQDLANHFGIAQSQVGRIVRGESRKFRTEDAPLRSPSIYGRKRHHLSDLSVPSRDPGLRRDLGD